MKIALVSTRIIESKHNEPHFSASKTLVYNLAKFGYDCLLLTDSSQHVGSIIARLKPDLIVLSGGENIGINLERDNLEYALLSESKLNQIPVLGICRGMQIMSTFVGCKLIRIEDHVGKSHLVMNPDESVKFRVNSFHNFAITNLPDELVINFTSIDGAIESVSHKTFPWLGIMWHPEREGNDASNIEILEKFFKKICKQ